VFQHNALEEKLKACPHLPAAGQILSVLQFSKPRSFSLVPQVKAAMIFPVNRSSTPARSSFPQGPACCHHAVAPRRAGFTLIELLVVMGIIVILLVAVIPVVNSLSKSSGRKAAISNLLGVIEQAHSQAIKDGQATYVVFPTFTSGSQPTLDRYHYKSYAIFEDDPAAPTVPKQLTNWKTLPSGVALRSSGNGNLPSLTASSSLTPPFTPTFGPDTTATAAFQCIKFNSSGEVESPANNVVLTVFEGYVNGTNEVVTGNKDGSGNPSAVESINIARLTGRAVSAQ
jgi:prepilin-type N-terminal cleavage/methylation domain-containing protein